MISIENAELVCTQTPIHMHNFYMQADSHGHKNIYFYYCIHAHEQMVSKFTANTHICTDSKVELYSNALVKALLCAKLHTRQELLAIRTISL